MNHRSMAGVPSNVSGDAAREARRPKRWHVAASPAPEGFAPVGLYCFDQGRQVLAKVHTMVRTLASEGHAMQEFVRNANIAEFRKLLAEVTDEDQRRILLK